MYLREDKTESELRETIIQPVKSSITGLNGCFFDYVYIRIAPITEEESRLLVEIKCIEEMPRDIVVGYLSEYTNLQAAYDKDRQLEPKPKWNLYRKSTKNSVNEAEVSFAEP